MDAKHDKTPQGGAETVCTLTPKEAYAVAEFIDCNLLGYIRSDTDIDSMDWLKSIVHAYEKMCKASGFVGLTESEDDCN